jgi:hypothetical protein
MNQVVKDHPQCHIVQALLHDQHVVKHQSKKIPEKIIFFSLKIPETINI